MTSSVTFSDARALPQGDLRELEAEAEKLGITPPMIEVAAREISKIGYDPTDVEVREVALRTLIGWLRT